MLDGNHMHRSTMSEQYRPDRPLNGHLLPQTKGNTKQPSIDTRFGLKRDSSDHSGSRPVDPDDNLSCDYADDRIQDVKDVERSSSESKRLSDYGHLAPSPTQLSECGQCIMIV